MADLSDVERLLLERFPKLLRVMEGPHGSDISASTYSYAAALRPELLQLVQLLTGTLVKGAGREVPYAAAQITLIDRDDGEGKAICYPITRVTLLNVFNNRMPEPYRSFRVGGDGWEEEQ